MIRDKGRITDHELRITHHVSRITYHGLLTQYSVVLKTLEKYIDQQESEAGTLASFWLSVRRDRRFTFLLAMSVVFHLIFYAALIKLDSWAMMRAIAGSKSQVSLVRMIELAPPPDRSTLRNAPEPIERADVSRLQFDPRTADDVHVIPRSPKPAEHRGNSGRLPTADVIERQLRASRGSGDRNRPGPPARQSEPPESSSIPATRIPQLDEAMVAQLPPTQSSPAPPTPAPRQDASATTAAGAEASAGTRRGNRPESSALGLDVAQGQYMAYVRAKIRKTNERIMPREWIKDILRDKVSAEFELVIRSNGQILSTRLSRGSGYPVLDDYARQAIYTASPFEGFPQAAGNTIIFTVTVYFFPL